MKKTFLFFLCLLLTFALFGCKEENTLSLEGDVYPRDAQFLDLRDREISIDYHRQLQELLPECQILWNVPFQGGSVSCDAEEITVTALNAEDAEILLTHFPQLSHIHAEDCADYAQLVSLQESRPGWTVDYFVTLAGKRYHPTETKVLTLDNPNAGELMANLAYLPQMQAIHFSQLDMPAADLLSLVEAYPNIAFTWEKTVLDTLYPSSLTELDLSGAQLESAEDLEAELAYFPNLETVVLSHCNLDSETLAAYRDRVRDQYKVVWSVKLGKEWTRTDTETFMPVREGQEVRDSDLTELKYCEDLIVVDLGHMLGVSNIDWIYHTPKLQYLILVETWVSDITPIGTLKELIYLELFKCSRITDYTPLLGCTALQDLNLSTTKGDISVLAQMTWLDSLWANNCGGTEEQKQLLRESLPNTLLELDSPWWLGGGWRDRPNYYIMRDILEMPYIPTGAFHPRFN